MKLELQSRKDSRSAKLSTLRMYKALADFTWQDHSGSTANQGRVVFNTSSRQGVVAAFPSWPVPPCSGNCPACFPVWGRGRSRGAISNMKLLPHLTSTVPLAGNPAELADLGLFVLNLLLTTGWLSRLEMVAYKGPRTTTERLGRFCTVLHCV